MTRETPFSQLKQFTHIDRHFADFLIRLQGTEDHQLWLAAALVSSATQSGNVCIDLRTIGGKPLTTEEDETAEIVYAPQLTDWVSVLKESKVVGAPGEYRPLVLDPAGRLYLYRYWQYERRLAELLKRFAAADLCSFDPVVLNKSLPSLFPQQESGEPDCQRLAAVTAILRKLSLVTGGPGTGKTSTVLRILALLIEQPRHQRTRIALAAPTGKAAARLKEVVKQSKDTLLVNQEVLARIPEQAFTLHRLLGYQPGSRRFRHDSTNPLPFEMIVVDEASMVDLPLMAGLVDAVSPDARLLLLGDRDQLASVEPGAVFGDICEVAEAAGWSREFGERIKSYVPALPESSSIHGPLKNSVTVLRKSYRFAAESGIGQLARSVQAGDREGAIHVLSARTHPDVIWEEVVTPSVIERRLRNWILEAYSGCLQAASSMEALTRFAASRILCAVREGRFGVAFVNQIAQESLARKGLVRSRGTWYRGRPVMISQNDYQVRLFNGDIGIAWEEEPARVPTGASSLSVVFPMEGGEMRRVLPSRLPEHETVYAMTVHKAQGSEFDHVLLILPDYASPVLTREMLYTGITRARKRIEIWARRETIEWSIERRAIRHSGLRDALSQA